MEKTKQFLKKHRKALVLSLAAVTVAVFLMSNRSDAAGRMAQVAVTTQTITNYNSFVGNVQPSLERDVYAKAGAEVMEVRVARGDTVKEGDILAVLDTGDAEYNIALKEATIAATETSNAYTIRDAQRTYDNYKETLDRGLNSSLQSAGNQLQNAAISLQSAQEALAGAETDINNGTNQATSSAKNALDQAKSALDTAQSAYDSAVSDVSAREAEVRSIQDQINQANQSAGDTLRALQTAADNAEQKLGAKKTERDQKNAEIATLKSDLDNAADDDEKARINADIVRAESEKATLDAEVSTLEAELQTAQSQLSEASSNAGLSELEARLAQAQAALSSAKAARDSASKTLDNARTSRDNAQTQFDQSKENAIENMKNDLESAERSYTQAAANYNAVQLQTSQQLGTYEQNLQKSRATANTRASRLELENLKEGLEDYVILSPCDGVVRDLNIRVGDTVNNGMTAAVISDLSVMEISIKIDEYSVLNVKEGDPVSVFIDASGKEYEGEMTWIADTATIENGVSYFEATVRFVRDEDVRGGMSAEVRLVTVHKENVAVVPVGAVRYRDNNTAYVLIPDENGEAAERDVSLGASDGTFVEITEGLDAEESVFMEQEETAMSFPERGGFGGNAGE